MVNSQELAQLREIHLPDPIGWWPLAPGWYLLAIGSIIGLMIIMMWLCRCYSNGQAKREALRLLSIYQQQYRREVDSQLMSARLSGLLKRVALAYYPRTKVASLQGDEWIDFLNKTSKNMDFSLVRVALLELPYQRVTNLADVPRLDRGIHRSRVGIRSLDPAVKPRDVENLSLSCDMERVHDLNLLFSMARTWIKRRGRPCLN